MSTVPVWLWGGSSSLARKAALTEASVCVIVGLQEERGGWGGRGEMQKERVRRVWRGWGRWRYKGKRNEELLSKRGCGKKKDDDCDRNQETVRGSRKEDKDCKNKIFHFPWASVSCLGDLDLKRSQNKSSAVVESNQWYLLKFSTF